MSHKFAKPTFKLWCKRVGKIIDNTNWEGKLNDGFDFQPAYIDNAFQNPQFNRLAFSMLYHDQQTQENREYKYDLFWFATFTSPKTAINVWNRFRE